MRNSLTISSGSALIFSERRSASPWLFQAGNLPDRSYGASRGQEVAKALGYGMTAAGAYALHQAGCSAEAILKITTVFLNNVKENQWNLNDDQPKGPE
jgi:hypothetical protein